MCVCGASPWCVCTVAGVHDTDTRRSSFERSSTDTQDGCAAQGRAINKSLGRRSGCRLDDDDNSNSNNKKKGKMKRNTVPSVSFSAAAECLRRNQGFDGPPLATARLVFYGFALIGRAHSLQFGLAIQRLVPCQHVFASTRAGCDKVRTRPS